MAVKQCISPGPDREHTVYRYTDQIYKVVQFYSVRVRYGPGPTEHQKHYDTKLASSLARSRRVILEKALCNHWEWFCTFTIADDKADRKNLTTWWERFSQWLRDQRKKGNDIRYLLVPERHKDGSWHAHGLLAGVPEAELITFREMDMQGYRTPKGRRLPHKLRNSQYYNWTAYQEKFGFCSLGKIKNPVAAGFYITKYITKDQDRMVKDVGLHSYYVSRGLLGAEKHVDFFGRDPEIDALLVNKYDFCATGMTHVKQDLDWSYCMEFVDFGMLEPLVLSGDHPERAAHPAEIEANSYYEFEQMTINM